MKIQIDTERKEIILIEKVNLGEFLEYIRNIIPDYEEWFLNIQISPNNNYPHISNVPNPNTNPYDNPYEPLKIWYIINTK